MQHAVAYSRGDKRDLEVKENRYMKVCLCKKESCLDILYVGRNGSLIEEKCWRLGEYSPQNVDPTSIPLDALH